MAKSAFQIKRREQLEAAIASQTNYVTQDAIAVSAATKKLEDTVAVLNRLQAELAQLDEIEGRDP